METQVKQLSPRSKALIAAGVVLFLVAVGSLFYGFTQRQVEKEKEKSQLLVQQINEQKQTNTTLNKQIQDQSSSMQALQQRLDMIQATSMHADTSKTGVTIVKEYDPSTGMLIREMSNKIEELDKSIMETKAETHTAATSTVATTASTSTTVAAATSTIETKAATTTVAIIEKEKTVVKPADSGKKHEMRLTIGAAYHDNKVKPVAGYTVKAFGIGKVITVGPGIVLGPDLAGGAVQADVFDLPRIGAGYGCNLKGKACGPLFNIGIRLDF